MKIKTTVAIAVVTALLATTGVAACVNAASNNDKGNKNDNCLWVNNEDKTDCKCNEKKDKNHCCKEDQTYNVDLKKCVNKPTDNTPPPVTPPTPPPTPPTPAPTPPVTHDTAPAPVVDIQTAPAPFAGK